MLRLDLFEFLCDITTRKFSIQEVKLNIVEFLNDEGIDIEKWNEKVKIDEILTKTTEITMLDSARILYSLDMEGVNIVGDGHLDDDPEWESLSDLLDN